MAHHQQEVTEEDFMNLPSSFLYSPPPDDTATYQLPPWATTPPQTLEDKVLGPISKPFDPAPASVPNFQPRNHITSVAILREIYEYLCMLSYLKEKRAKRFVDQSTPHEYYRGQKNGRKWFKEQLKWDGGFGGSEELQGEFESVLEVQALVANMAFAVLDEEVDMLCDEGMEKDRDEVKKLCRGFRGLAEHAESLKDRLMRFGPPALFVALSVE